VIGSGRKYGTRRQTAALIRLLAQLHPPCKDVSVAPSSVADDTLSQTLPTAHWTQLERPAEVNGIIRKWLEELDIKQGHQRDEL
jgi:hypothetical protein